MKTLTMTPYQARTLKLRLEGREKGYSVAEERKLDSFLLGLEAPIREYEAGLDKAGREYPQQYTEAGYPLPNTELREAIDRLNEEYPDPYSFNSEDEPFELIKDVWNEKGGHSGQGENRRTVIAIDDAIKAATNGKAES